MTSTDRPLGAWASVRLVAGREIVQRARTKSLLWTTVVLVVLILAGSFAAKVLLDSETTLTVGVTEPGELSAALTSTAGALGSTVETETVSDTEGRERVRDEELDALLVGGIDDFSVVTRADLDPALEPILTTVAQQAALAAEITALGGDPSAVGSAMASVALDVERLEPPQEVDASQTAFGIISGVLLFIALQTCGQMVAQGVVEEKTSRVVELLLSTVRPWQLMAGKVLGIGAIGLGQIVVLGGAVVAGVVGFGLAADIEVDLGATAAWALAWFVVGFTMYAVLYAALGALVSRQEEVATVTSPLLLLMMAPYVVGISIAPYAPDNPLVEWLSYLPFTAPLIMPIRVAMGTVPDWQVLAVLGLNVAVIPLLVWFAGRIYGNAVLRTGSRIKVKDALRAA